MKNKILSFIKNINFLVITGVFAALTIGLIYYFQKVAPFGNNGLLTIDFFHQYGPMLAEFYDRVKSGANLIYSFDTGLGLPIYRNFFNYLSSPFNLLLFLFNRDNLVMGFSIIISLKVITASITMCYFLSKKIGKNFFIIPLSFMYAFCAYFTAFYWNIMWLDGLVFLPLIILGIERIVNNKKPLLYIISLFLMMIANYFIAYMICIFSLIYFIGYLVIKTNNFNIKSIIKKFILFIVSSIAAGALAAFALIPMFMALKSISATGDLFATSQYYLFSFKEFVFNHFSGNIPTVLKSDISNAPNIAVGILSIPLLLLFIINNKISLKSKIVYLLMIAILSLSFVNGSLDYIWHAFHVPNDLPFRYSFIYSFILVIICAYSLKYLKNINYYKVAIIYIIMLILIGLIYFLKIETINQDMLVLNLSALTIYFLVYTINKKFNGSKLFTNFFLVVTVCLEMVILTNNNWNISQNIYEFYADYNTTTEALKHIKDNDENFYRFEKVFTMTFNDAAWYNYYGQGIFSSMAYENLAFLQHKLGIPGNEINSYYYKQTTPVYDLMFNIKYYNGITYDSKYYSIAYQVNNSYIYNSLYNAGLMFGVNSMIKTWEFHGDNPFYIQNNFIKKSSGKDKDVFNKVLIKEKNTIFEENNINVIQYTVDANYNNLYYYVDDANVDFILIDSILYYKNNNYTYIDKIDELNILDYKPYNESFIINHLSENKEKKLYVAYNNNYYDSLLVYSLDEDNFIEAYKILKENEVNIVEFKENYINASIDNKENLTIYTSIPYDKGWRVLVNKKEVKTFEIGNSLLAFDIGKGNNQIELSYQIPGFKLGLFISGFSLLIIMIYYFRKK